VRIISGQFKGKNIQAPASLPARPTTDFAKTALFNILNNRVDFESISVLDLFCGTGNISYEFMSRGCRKLTVVDADGRSVKFVKETMANLGVDGVRFIKSDVFRFLETSHDKYDIIFADPPFDLKETDRLPALILNQSLLNEDGLLIIEHQAKRKLESEWLPGEVRVYGNCAFSIYQNQEKPGMLFP
jgi:16S rRNA (guanine(966)-N(2))-methyltransferase RsmD